MSALDLVVEDGADDPLVTEMSIDTFREILGGSDHSAIFFKLRIKPVSSIIEPQEEDPIVGPNQQQERHIERPLKLWCRWQIGVQWILERNVDSSRTH